MITEFITENGIKVPAVTVKQMREIDRIAIDETGPNLFQMMENAGRNLAELTMDVLGDKWKQQNIIVLAGTGGNGGGGICAARHLSNHGGNIKLCITDAGKLKEVPAYQLHIVRNTNAKLISIQELEDEKPDLIIDAIIGYSLEGKPNGNALHLIKWAENQLCIKISLDIPSGVNATTSKHSKHFIKPDLTLTLGLPKTGLAPELTGELFLGDIGIPHKAYNKVTKNFISPFKNNFILKLSVDLYR